ncbi:hypothetical protein [Adhaeribacter pallidiroseus]|uniref:Uncharacterized protein n=1 Tax=Adhaeribacter pallidiroseus TaxID=2072847 RepID=A0A369QNH4_9BACT|nr:hypothetical protein [Adhaeribacter pallidiroseus]RDC64409.1 hypothetical protein AHMF7616_03023 [Adhaeribacter pallidiroseus]
MNVINKHWEADLNAPRQQNLFGFVDLPTKPGEETLIASYWPWQESWQWRIYLFNNVPDMQESGTCATEEVTRQTIQYYIGLTQ